jgi:hypothetical protein
VVSSPPPQSTLAQRNAGRIDGVTGSLSGDRGDQGALITDTTDITPDVTVLIGDYPTFQVKSIFCIDSYCWHQLATFLRQLDVNTVSITGTILSATTEGSEP